MFGKDTAPAVGINVLQLTLSGPDTVPVPTLPENTPAALVKKFVLDSSISSP
jgi:hypothetical protein